MSEIIKKMDVENLRSKRWIHVRWLLLRLCMVAYDAVAVNISVYLALITRFYVADEFNEIAIKYLDAFSDYAVVYTVFCLIVFASFKFYSSMWKYAGFRDWNRIIAANTVTFVGHVAGTLLFGIRMPITVYCISAVILLCLVGSARFSYRIIRMEKEVLGRNKATVNALIVGVGGEARNVVEQMEHNSMVRPVCMLNYKQVQLGFFFNGIPVIYGVENLKNAIEKYHVNLVVFASNMLSKQVRNEICDICSAEKIEVEDYSGIFRITGMDITLRNLAVCSEGPVELVINGHHQQFDSGEQAMMSVEGRYIIKSISARDNVLVAELMENNAVLNDLSEKWVQELEHETGEEISFF